MSETGPGVGHRGDLEGLLARALAPVEPPERLATRLRATLQSISELAAEELEGWELASMRDPRNWARPAVAVVAGTVAGAGLLLLGRHGARSERMRRLATRLGRSVATRARGIFPSR